MKKINVKDNRFSRIENTEISFENAIDKIFTGNVKGLNRQFFKIAETPDFLKNIGVTGRRFTMSYGVISRHLNKDKGHKLTPEVWKQLPQALQTPFAVTEYTKKNRAYRIYTTLQLENGWVVVGVDVKNMGRDIDVNSISTVFNRVGKITNDEIILWLSEKITPQQKAIFDKP